VAVEPTTKPSSTSERVTAKRRSRGRALLERARPLLPRRVYNWAAVQLYWRFSDDRGWQARDDEWNDRETPPSEERLRWHAVWLVEAYLPSNIPALLAGLERLGWQKKDDESVADFISNCRLSLGGGGLMHLPMLRPPVDKGSYFPDTLKRDLPLGVKLVTGQVQIVAYALTLLIVGFRFDESVSGEVDVALRRRYQTFTRRTRAGRSIMHTTFQRRDAMRDLEAAKIHACREWLAARVPGYFASTDGGPDTPATALLTTKVGDLFGDANWMRPVGLGHGVAYEQWGTPIAGLRYTQRSRKDGVPLLFGRESDLLGDARLTQNGQSWEWLLPHFVEMQLTEVLGLAALDATLTNAGQRLARLRDSIVTKDTSTERQLDSVSRQLRSLSSDIASLTTEIGGWTAEPAWAFRETPEMQVVETLSKQPSDGKPFRVRSIEWITHQAREVGELESTTRDLLLATSEITSALENIKLQRSVRKLTWVLVGIGVATAILAFVSAIAAAHGLGWIGPTSSPLP